MVSINGAARKNVCRLYSSYYYYPDKATSLQICERLHFHTLVRVVNTDHQDSLYPFRTRYSSGMYYLRSCNPTCSYSVSSACRSTIFYTKISCGCSGNFYATADGWIPCPTNSVNATGTVGRCSCEAGLYWSGGHCLPCPAYKYSAANSVNCTQCPNGATSTPGSSNCVCFPGLHKEGTECRECGGNTFSVRNTTSCTDCPENSTASLDHSACECQSNYLWNSASNNCTEKEKHHSEEPSTNMTTTVLSNNTAQPLTTMQLWSGHPGERLRNPGGWWWEDCKIEISRLDPLHNHLIAVWTRRESMSNKTDNYSISKDLKDANEHYCMTSGGIE